MRRRMNLLFRAVIGTFCVISICGFSFSSEKENKSRHEVKYIIFMVPDGMGLADVTATRIQKNGINGAPLYLETLESIGYHHTHSKDSTITDSAAAASAMACGEKFNNGEVCYHSETNSYPPSILELARAKGMATGLVATSTITHATPACFGSHVVTRDDEPEIARQYIEVTQPDVVLGGGMEYFTSLIPEAIQKGYSVVDTQNAMTSAVSQGARKLLGLFNADALTPEMDRTPGITEPRLPDMARAALKVLQQNQRGFFVMIEGSQIDWGNHDNNYPYQLAEMLAFDEAVKVVLDWINASPERQQHTLLIIAPDHETGGFAVGGGEGIPLGQFVPAWLTDYGDHTGGDEPTWSQGPGSELLGKSIDNTQIYAVMTWVLK